ALRWATALRDIIAAGASVPAILADAHVDIDVEDVAAAAKAWREARDELLALSADGRLGEALNDPAQAPTALAAFEVAEGEAEAWRSAATVRDDLVRLGFGSLVASLLSDRIPADLVAPGFAHALYDAAAKAVLADDHRFDQATGEALERLREEFATLDRRSIRHIAPMRVAAAVAERYESGRLAHTAAEALIRREDLKQRRHRHLRQLLSDPGVAGAVQAVKPCFMMSPLSVSQFLPAGVRFDVVVFDEASQVLPEDALGALYRADSLVVAGDERQLPPTNFFLAGVDDDPDNDDADDDAGAFESLLAIASGTPGVDTIPLRWHYRSRHQSLIAFSNRRFYADRPMVVFPAAHPARDDLGVAFHRVPDAVYDRGVGASHTNRLEAEAVVRIVCDHLRERPGLSIGVVALSRQQSDLIRDLLEDTVRDIGLPVDFDDPTTGLFVKNLENVQGDDRDVIVLSIGYGRDAAGRLPSNFGPVSRKGGWRRLNVAVTRARCRLDVVSSIRAGDIRTDAEGAAHLRAYLDYAERGLAALVESVDGEAECESPFEADVAALIRSWGYDVVPQVGVDGFRIDLAVRDPLQAGRFAVGIECDGAAYHSSADARERDRLRQEVLEGLGWRIHRIWGPSWYRLRAREETRLAAVLREHVVGFAPTTSAPVSADTPTGGTSGSSTQSTLTRPVAQPRRIEQAPRRDLPAPTPSRDAPALRAATPAAALPDPANPVVAPSDAPVTPSPPHLPGAAERDAATEPLPACPACGSYRLLDGPPYNREARRCLECGWSQPDQRRADP
ncbi:MAG: AAA domain-containing protein, partial [Acidimicrobiia bacterium]